MKNFTKNFAIIVLIAVVFGVGYFFGSARSERLPSNARLVEEMESVSLYNVNIPVSYSVSGIERAYIVDNDNLLGVLDINYDWTASLILVTDEEVVVLADSGAYPGKSGIVYTIKRNDGAVASRSVAGEYFFTDPSNTYAAFGTQGGTLVLNSFGNQPARSFPIGGDYAVSAMALSPDEQRILVVAFDVNLSTEEIIYASVFLTDLEHDVEAQQATKIFSFTESGQEGPFVPFMETSTIIWNSDTQVSITDDYGNVHEIEIPI